MALAVESSVSVLGKEMIKVRFFFLFFFHCVPKGS